MPRIAALLLATALAAGAAGAAHAEDPICAAYKGAVARASAKSDVAALDRVIGSIPSACAELKANAQNRRAQIVAEQQRAAAASAAAASAAATSAAAGRAQAGPQTRSNEAAGRLRERTDAQAQARTDRRADDAAFGIAEAANTESAYLAYLGAYPTGAHAAEARELRNSLSRRASGYQASGAVDYGPDDAAWRAAQAANTTAAYDAYLASYPSGRHVAEAQTARTVGQSYRIHVCNKSSRNVAFAAVFQPMGDSTNWKHQGWWRVAPNDCSYIFETMNPSFAIRAESLDDSTTWAGTTFQQCFINPGPYEFTNANASPCPAGSTMKNAYQLTATNRGDYSWSVGN